MPVDLPPSIHDYFTGKNARDFTVAVSGFAQSAVVKDEGRLHTGPGAIRDWIEGTVARYDDQADVKSAVANGTGVEVVAEVSGSFPGSPILLRFNFALKDEEIVRLEIAP